MTTPKKDDRVSASRVLEEIERMHDQATADGAKLNDVPEAKRYFEGFCTGLRRLHDRIERMAK